MLLLHGYRVNNEDDFAELHDYFSKFNEYEVMNEDWFDNYNLDTLNSKHLTSVVNDISNRINNKQPKEVVIVAYSTGALVALLIKDLLECSNIRYYAMVAPYKVSIWEWNKRFKDLRRQEEALIKRMGKERYEKLKAVKIEQGKLEKYPIEIFKFIYKDIIRKHGRKLSKINNGNFLLAKDDHVIDTEVTLKAISKDKSNNISIEDFKHDQLLKQDKEIFINWFYNVFK